MTAKIASDMTRQTIPLTTADVVAVPTEDQHAGAAPSVTGDRDPIRCGIGI